MDAKNANVSTNLFNVFIAFQAWNPNIVQGVRFGGQLMPQNWLLIDLHFYLDFVLFHWPCSLEAFASFFSRFPSNLLYLLAKISNETFKIVYLVEWSYLIIGILVLNRFWSCSSWNIGGRGPRSLLRLILSRIRGRCRWLRSWKPVSAFAMATGWLITFLCWKRAMGW